MHYMEAKSILSPQGNMNLYRGCTHGCIYCDSRSRCYGFDHAFEDVAVKRNAPALLEEALRRRKKRIMIGTGSMSDPYQPLEQTQQLTRKCALLAEKYGFGFSVITKSDLVLRDLELLSGIQKNARCVVQVTLTTADEALCSLVEPKVCTTKRRVEVLHALRAAGIPTVVWLSPFLPFLNDTEENLRALLAACFDAGVRGILCFGVGVTMREGNREYFYAQLDRLFPGVRRQYERAFGLQYECASPSSGRLMALFHEECEKHRVLHRVPEVFSYLHAFGPEGPDKPLTLF